MLDGFLHRNICNVIYILMVSHSAIEISSTIICILPLYNHAKPSTRGFQFFFPILQKIIDFLISLAPRNLVWALPYNLSKIQSNLFKKVFWIFKTTYLSPPICSSSKVPHLPSTSSVSCLAVVCIDPPHAFNVLLRSSSATRPAQNISLHNKTILEISINKVLMRIYDTKRTYKCEGVYRKLVILTAVSHSAIDKSVSQLFNSCHTM